MEPDYILAGLATLTAVGATATYMAKNFVTYRFLEEVEEKNQERYNRILNVCNEIKDRIQRLEERHIRPQNN